jgi:hypothetical protein
MQFIFSIIAVLGVGSIVAAVISWFVAISNHRQAWINALREDIATYLKELEFMYHPSDILHGDGNRTLEQIKRETHAAAQFTYWRIVMRLNRSESMHIELREKLDELMKAGGEGPDGGKIEKAIDLARQVLKQEWEVTKYGVFAPVAIRLKKWWRGSNE